MLWKTTALLFVLTCLAQACVENPLVTDNNAPVADAGDDQELEYDGDPVSVTLDGSRSADSDGDVVSYQWLISSRIECDGKDDDDECPEHVEKPKVMLDEGRYHFTLWVTDNKGAVSDPDTVMITVGNPPDEVADAGTDDGTDDGDDGGVEADAGPVTSVAPVDGMCGDNVCATPMLGDICCTAPGVGEEGSALEVYGRTDGLCGADITIVALLAGLCLQLNQPGTLTTDCEEMDPGFGVEAGCCTDEGFCGIMNTTVPLGCHYPTAGKGEACSP